MRVALAQINSTVGDFSGNRQKILDYIFRAKEKHCDLVVFPELALFGYLPADLLERESIVKEQLKEYKMLQKEIPSGIGVLLGLITESKKKPAKPFCNSAAFLEKGQKPKIFCKELLPSYDIFDEARYFEPGNVEKNILHFRKKKILVTVCEDIWGWGSNWSGANYSKNPLTRLKGTKLDLAISINASPYSKNKIKLRENMIKKSVQFLKAPMIYVNMVGAQDEIIFDGGSLVMSKASKIIAQSVYFEEDLNIVDLEKNVGGIRKKFKNEMSALHQALVLGVRDFINKNGFKKVHLGVSGGIDSAVVLCLAVDALGPGRVAGLAMPGPFSSPESLVLAEKLCKNVGVSIETLSIIESYEAIVGALDKSLGKAEFSIMHENIQARLRGLILMAYGNSKHSLLLTTGNKSEYATGYTTLYGDMCGGLAPIADLLKREVYSLAEYFNREFELIPTKILKRAPSAELRPNQKDQDTLPPYDELDRIVEKIVELGRPASGTTEKWVLNALFKSEFKRWQAPPILRVSSHAFGKGRRLPITNKALF